MASLCSNINANASTYNNAFLLKTDSSQADNLVNCKGRNTILLIHSY